MCVIEFCRDIILDRQRVRVGKKNGIQIYLDAVPSLPCVCWCCYFQIIFALTCSEWEIISIQLLITDSLYIDFPIIFLGLKTLFWPCGTFSKVASVATGKQISKWISTTFPFMSSACSESEEINYRLQNWYEKYILIIAASAEACNEMMAYSLVLSCCCYTCCIRQKLRRVLNIKVPCTNLAYDHDVFWWKCGWVSHN